MIRKNEKLINRTQFVLDIVVLIFAFLITWYAMFGLHLFSNILAGRLSFYVYFKVILLMLPIYIIAFNFFNLYAPFRYSQKTEQIYRIIEANSIATLIFVVVLYFSKMMHYSRGLLIIFYLISNILLISERIILINVMKSMRKKGINLKHIVIIGCNDLTLELLERLSRNKQWGYSLLAIFKENGDKPLSSELSSNELIRKYKKYNIDELENYLKKNKIDEVFITLRLKDYEKLNQMIDKCEAHGVRASIIPDYFRYIPAKPYVDEMDDLPVINIRYIPLDEPINKFLKRMFDIVISLLCILIFSPIMIIVALSVKLTSPGPIIFKQERVGLNKKKFNMYKFRSMKQIDEKVNEKMWTKSNDPRKTKLGTFIRKTSMDELPQLFNVLKGDMSLIGPRPERPFFVQEFQKTIPKYMVKHQVRPGMTGWAQVNGWRGDTSIEKRIECDIYYIENWSLLLDIKILFLTVARGFVNKNAY
ncbi:undecaprenyl-phosphate glucose phosphotransferase [Clostridium oryzae]|uniref:UDP-glucose:undecaprenyl-phosphate glucose-1-phosphate transferase n=1 Tax=Clostridium oryzae TaxID=1450648 RepID=A0A1V4IYA3_9CLOT|nr:undecaprenyl-phosphate glucose phosphotransferase [Clostridium oryzae]OPJ65052.1 UDP-glucose:undecaprenyl-phosphate glucose-1-phosphate transferase [Clostridium oryzae]